MENGGASPKDKRAGEGATNWALSSTKEEGTID